MNAEERRLVESRERTAHWKRWGPYVADRAWGTVREDYSAGGAAWEHFPHDHARSRAYRWNEDGLAGICDRHQVLCFALSLWNGRDPILKERLFGLSGTEGNHAEDVKELYFHLDATPTHSYLKFLYKYPQAEFPYARLVEENARRGRGGREFELLDTGVFDAGRYFDVAVEYAKATPEDILVRIEASNRGPEAAPLELLPTLWYRNTWSWDGSSARPVLRAIGEGPHARRAVAASHPEDGEFWLGCDGLPELLFTENETNGARLHGLPPGPRGAKDAFHEVVVHGRTEAANGDRVGTKAAARYRLVIPAGESRTIRLRLRRTPVAGPTPVGADFEETLAARRREADEFYEGLIPKGRSAEERRVMRQAFAGLLWSKQFYHY
ncbi:MAG TPA: glucosidase, partial [Thermoanaerobaculia bacterium]|nr:glucosidase [Thermoanaerobaculia bacterium]